MLKGKSVAASSSLIAMLEALNEEFNTNIISITDSEAHLDDGLIDIRWYFVIDGEKSDIYWNCDLLWDFQFMGIEAELKPFIIQNIRNFIDRRTRN